LPDAKNPNTVLFDEGPRAPSWAQSNLLSRRLQLQFIAGFQMQLIPQRLRNNDPASLIDEKASIHGKI
jgi:hypothetical protein